MPCTPSDGDNVLSGVKLFSMPLKIKRNGCIRYVRVQLFIGLSVLSHKKKIPDKNCPCPSLYVQQPTFCFSTMGTTFWGNAKWNE